MNYIKKFEQLFAEKYQMRQSFSFWKGRVAMYAILKALGIGPGHEVILPGYTCVMNVNPIKYLGAKSVYVDIEPLTYNINVNLLEEKITRNTKAIIAQHTYGYPCEMDSIMDIAARHGIPVIEDCCLALGSTYKGKLCGSFGKAAYFSFQWNKPLTTGIGGLAITNETHLADKISEICEQEMNKPSFKAAAMLSAQRLVYRIFIYPRTTAIATNLFRWLTKKGLVIGSSSICEFMPEMTEDFFMSMSGSQAQAGLRQLRNLDSNIAHRRIMRIIYDKLLDESGYNISKVPEFMDPVLVRYPIRVNNKEKAIEEAPIHGVEIGSWFECPLHPAETPMHLYDYQEGMCPVSERACREVVNLPLHPRVSEKTVRRTIEFIARFIPVS